MQDYVKWSDCISLHRNRQDLVEWLSILPKGWVIKNGMQLTVGVSIGHWSVGCTWVGETDNNTMLKTIVKPVAIQCASLTDSLHLVYTTQKEPIRAIDNRTVPCSKPCRRAFTRHQK